MSNSRLFPAGQLSIIEQGGIRGLCYTRVLDDSSPRPIVENAWFVRKLTPPPRAPLAFRHSGMQPNSALDVDDVHDILVDAWQQLALPEDDVQAWGDYVTVFDTMVSGDPEDYAIPTPPASGFATASNTGNARRARNGDVRPMEMDGGEIFAFDPSRGNLITAQAFRPLDGGSSLAVLAGASWNEYWVLSADARSVDAQHSLVVEPEPSPYGGLPAFLSGMMTRVNDDGAHLLISTVLSYGTVSFTTGNDARAKGASYEAESEHGAGG